MKRAILFMYLLSLAVIFSCETDKIVFTGPDFVRFNDASLTEKESFSKPIILKVQNTGAALVEDIDVTYSIGGSAREGIDYAITSERGVIHFNKGDYFDSITVQLINNSNNILRSQDVIFTLKTVSTNKIQIGQGDSAIGSTFTLTIQDDCILGGTYIGRLGSPDVPGISITSADCETYTLSNWNINVFSDPSPMDLKFIDNGDNTLTIPEQEEETIDPDLATIRGTGVVDPVTRQIIMTITLVDFDNQPEVTIALIPD